MKRRPHGRPGRRGAPRHGATAAGAALLAAALLAACAPPAIEPAPAMEPAPAPSATAAATPGGATLPPIRTNAAAIAAARADSVERPWTAADARFMTMMIPHHAQALEMAALAPDRAASDQVRTLAARITNGQRDEIRVMRQWLADRQLPVPDPFGPGGAMAAAHEAHATMPMADAHAGHDGHAMGAAGGAAADTGDAAHRALMPGMLTPAQMTALAAARGASFDRLFLTYMIMHHRGAVGMVEELFGTYGAGQDHTVFKLASDVNVDQLTEIRRMQNLVLELEFGIRQP